MCEHHFVGDTQQILNESLKVISDNNQDELSESCMVLVACTKQIGTGCYILLHFNSDFS